jgi:HSP20 family protein
MMQREMENMLETFARSLEKAPEGSEDVFFTPVVEAREDEKGLTIEVDLPGIDPEDVSVELSEGVLTIKAERKMDREADEEKDGVKYHIAERAYGTFMRRFTLPWEADEDNIEASFDKGVLKVFIPRKVEDKKAKKITIKT